MRSLYRIAVGQGWVSPSEFWEMPPAEVWWLIDAHTPANAVNHDALYTLLLEAEAQQNG